MAKQHRGTVTKKKRTPRRGRIARTGTGAKRMQRVRKPAKRTRKLLWKATPEAQKVIDTTQDVFDNTPGAKSDCNKFVKAVCAALATDPFGGGDNADDITNDIRSDTWLTA